FRGKRLVGDLAGTDWDSRNPFNRIRVVLDSKGRRWAMDMIQAVGAWKGAWAKILDLYKKLPGSHVVRDRQIRQLEREGALEVSPKREVRLTLLEGRLEASLTKDDPQDDS